ncbi:uncharacterized protein METZ01_LOCUS422706, partial [marine metagenome]
PILVSAGFLVIGLSGNTRIHIFPVRLIDLLMATRAASIWRLVIQPGSNDLSPYSPKETIAPPLVWPRMRPRDCFRHRTFLGINIS